MTGWLSDSDRERIEEFAQTPKYERSPEMLAPESDEDDEE
jgi:hypothetical protein